MVSAGAMLLDRLGPPGFRFNDFGAPRLPYLFTLAREGADGQAVVCPLLRGSSPTRGVARKQHRGLGRAFTPAFRAGSLYPLARGCRRICRGERCKLWLMVSAGAMLLDRLGPPGFRFNDFGAPRLPYLFTLAREGADGQAVVCPLLRGSSPTRGVARKQHRGLGRAFTPAFRAGSLYPLARGCRRICRGERCKLWLMVSAGAMLLDRLGPPGFRFNDFGAPRLPYLFTLAREGADGQAVVCPLLRGSSPTRGVAPKQHNKAIADQSPLLKLSL